MLTLRPIDPTEELSVEHLTAPRDGVHWEYLLPDDSPLLVRTRDLVDDEEAQWDAERLFAARSPRIVYVRDRESGQLSWWLVRGAEPVLVGARVWLPTQRVAVVRAARRAAAALEAPQPPWGTYGG